MPGKIKVPFTKERLHTEYQQKSSEKIAIKYGVSKKYVLNQMKIFGIPRRDRIPPVDQVKTMANEGLSTIEIGKRLGFTSVYIRQIAKKNGIFIPDKFHVGYINHHGYIMVKKPGHPTADSKGYICVHRLIMEEHLGRFLNPGEIVHHKNRDRRDNRIENLELTTKGNHMWDFHKDVMDERFTKRKASKKLCAREDFS